MALAGMSRALKEQNRVSLGFIGFNSRCTVCIHTKDSSLSSEQKLPPPIIVSDGSEEDIYLRAGLCSLIANGFKYANEFGGKPNFLCTYLRYFPSTFLCKHRNILGSQDRCRCGQENYGSLYTHLANFVFQQDGIPLLYGATEIHLLLKKELPRTWIGHSGLNDLFLHSKAT
ncbi:hypothetical protein CDAR_249921 [Caerostris darwini]|uniref:Uncharacterized protein n=1 Tax=Caerostris darwini TaxID=1538125 RepID=A0AAV4NG24_9ARAC|nr:hypothetical protein CDAR_249921 [Caerostris darwini]